jgi:hypothetical protein
LRERDGGEIDIIKQKMLEFLGEMNRERGQCERKSERWTEAETGMDKMREREREKKERERESVCVRERQTSVFYFILFNFRFLLSLFSQQEFSS